MVNISTKYMGLNLKNPLIAGSSGLTDSVEKIKALEEKGIAAVVIKSLFEEEIIAEMEAAMKTMASGNFLYPETVDFYENEDSEESTMKYLDLIREAKKAVSIPVIASINCVTAKEWTYFPKQLEEAGADAIELNAFVLPSDLNRTAAENEQVYFDIINEVKKQVSIPVALKTSYYFSNLATTLQKFSESGIEGLVLFNRFYNTDFDIDKLEVTSGNVLSSPSDLGTSLRWVAIMANRVKCDLAASTGVHSGDDLIKQILAGADVVQIASTLYRNGFDHVEKMLTSLQNYMDGKGFKTLDDFRGKLSQATSENPAAYERIQFMTYFRDYKQ